MAFVVIAFRIWKLLINHAATANHSTTIWVKLGQVANDWQEGWAPAAVYVDCNRVRYILKPSKRFHYTMLLISTVKYLREMKQPYKTIKHKVGYEV